jgi:DNA-directed RNA polymerase subunit RPC12/RpoP
MRYHEVAPSRLPSLLVPCPHCVHRMVIAAVEPALLANGATSNDLQDITHRCVQCGTTLIRRIRSLSGAA